MVTDVELPQWLDKYIFNELGAKYCRSCSDMTVIDWNKNDILNYLGTYFPRSYAEAYCIFSELFRKYPQKWNDAEHLKMFDFGCGTGGEIIGMATAIAESVPNIKVIDVKALDGNVHALRLLEKVAAESSSHIATQLQIHISPCKIDDFYDFSVLDSVLDDHFDIVMSVRLSVSLLPKSVLRRRMPTNTLWNLCFPN